MKGREKELLILKNEVSDWDKKTTILIYGKHKVGKSQLLFEVAKNINGSVIFFNCVQCDLKGNMELIYKKVFSSLALPDINFDSFTDMLKFLGKLNEKIVFIIDEAELIYKNEKKVVFDSFIESISGNLPNNVKLIICGSYTSRMLEEIKKNTAFYNCFTMELEVKEFDYFESAKYYYPDLSINEKIRHYAIFGGNPYILNCLLTGTNIKDNIFALLLSSNQVIITYIENVVLNDVPKKYNIRILEAIGGGKKKYSEIKDYIKADESGLLDNQLKILINNGIIKKTEPINHKGDKKKRYYEIEDNLLKFYFTFIFGKKEKIGLLGAADYYKEYIENEIDAFVNKRLEEIVLEYFRRVSSSNKNLNVFDYGYYWFSNSINDFENIFECAINNEGQYELMLCDFMNESMPRNLFDVKRELFEVFRKTIDKEKKYINKLSFVCSAGFDPELKAEYDYDFIDGEMLFDNSLDCNTEN